MKNMSPPGLPVQKEATPPPETQKISSPPNKNVISPVSNKETHLPSFKSNMMLQKNVVVSPPVKEVILQPINKEVCVPSVNKVVTSPPPIKTILSPPMTRDSVSSNKNEVMSPPSAKVTSPPVNIFKFNKSDYKSEDNSVTSKLKKESVLIKEAPIKIDKLSLITMNSYELSNKNIDCDSNSPKNSDVANGDKSAESNGVGDKIRKFEKAAEDASLSAGKLSRPGSVRGRSRSERLGSDSKEDLPPPATPFKDHVFFDLGNADKSNNEPHNSNNTEPTFERQLSLPRGTVNSVASKWQHSESSSVEEKIQKPEPQKIIKPEFKPMPSPVDVTIRSPSLGTKLPDQFPSQGTAFRNVAPPDPARPAVKIADDVNNQNNFKTCILKKNKEKYSVSKGSSYFTRGSEEIWLVKKKDIEEIEERVLDSFRRAGGNVCMRSESMRPSSDSGQGTAFTHATMGRTKRQMYSRSESLDPQWAGARSQTLKRQSSVACTCGHDKKTRAKSAGPDTTSRPRSRSHGDENNQGHVLDKYETLV